MKYIYRKFVKDIDLSELDIDNLYKVFGKSGKNKNDDDYYDEISSRELITVTPKNKYGYYDESEEILIDDAINALQKLKKAGANYAQIVAHVDHHGYEFYGLEMREATEKEIAEFKEGKKEHNKKQKEEKIAELKKEIKKLEK